MKIINEGNKVKIISNSMRSYRKKEVGQFINEVGTVTAVHRAYQDETMYSVMFSLSPFIQGSFFEHEIELE